MCGVRRLTYADSRMKNLLITVLHFAVVTAKLCGCGGVRAAIPRISCSLKGYTPLTFATGHSAVPADLSQVRWVSHGRDLVQLPIAA